MNKFLALDFETGGLRPNEHAPVTLGVALMDEGGVIDSAEWLFADQSKHDKSHMRRDYQIGALQVSGVTWTRIQKEGIPAQEVMKQLAVFVKANDAGFATVVSHNAVFDQGFYSDLLFRLGGWSREFAKHIPQNGPLFGPWACTQRMFACLHSGMPTTLDDVAAHFGFARETETHGALEDAILAGRIFAALTTQAVAA